MTVAVLYGAGSGMLHAVTGPDHVLSLGPVALRQPRRSWRIGLAWGVGHAVGTLLLALPVLWLAHVVDVDGLAAVSDRVAGVALVVMSLWSLFTLRRHRHDRDDDHDHDHAHGADRSPFVVGVVHGATGAGALVLVLPVLVAGSTAMSAAFLVAFGVGSTLAMAVLTTCIARLSGSLSAKAVTRAQTTLTLLALVLGLGWMV